MRKAVVILIALVAVLPANVRAQSIPQGAVKVQGSGSFTGYSNSPGTATANVTAVGLGGPGSYDFLGGAGTLHLVPPGGPARDITIVCTLTLHNDDGITGYPDDMVVMDGYTSDRSHWSFMLWRYYEDLGTQKKVEIEQIGFEQNSRPPCLAGFNGTNGYVAIGEPIKISYYRA